MAKRELVSLSLRYHGANNALSGRYICMKPFKAGWIIALMDRPSAFPKTGTLRHVGAGANKSRKKK